MKVRIGDISENSGEGFVSLLVIHPVTYRLVAAAGVVSSKKGPRRTGEMLASSISFIGLDSSVMPDRKSRFLGLQTLIREVSPNVGKSWKEVGNFKFLQPEFGNLKLPTGCVYVSGNTREEAVAVLKERLAKTVKKMPIPIKNEEWISAVVDAAKITDLSVIKGDGVWLEGLLPEGSVLETALIGAQMKDEWLKYFKRVPALDSVRLGVEDVEGFELKQWATFLQSQLGGMDEFKTLPNQDQIGVVRLFELTGSNVAANAVRKYGKGIWHQMSLLGPLKARKRSRDLVGLIAKSQAVHNILVERLQAEQLSEEFSSKEAVASIEVEISAALSYLEALKAEKLDLDAISTEDVIEWAERLIAFVRSDAVSEQNPLTDEDVRLLTVGIGSAMQFIKAEKDEVIEKITTRRMLKEALLTLKYSNARNLDIATVCARSGVSQEEFEIYQNIWDDGAVLRSKRVSSFPTISGRSGDLIWEMCDADDVNILTAGNETNCCQHPLSVGGACVYWMLKNPSISTVFRVKKVGTDNTIAQSFVWLDKDSKILVFDNIEALGEVRQSVINCYTDYLSQISGQARLFDIRHATVGTGYSDVALGSFPDAVGEKKAKRPSDLGYSDTSHQKLLTSFNYLRGGK